MAGGITATAVKNWFQYGCERKFVFESFNDAEKRAAGIETVGTAGRWGQYGDDYETAVVMTRLGAGQPGQTRVLVPRRGSRSLGTTVTAEFLRRVRRHKFAWQAVLSHTETAARHLELPDGVKISRVKPDLLRVEPIPHSEQRSGGPTHRVTVIDVKSTRHVTLFQRAQIGFYAILLDCIIAEDPTLRSRLEVSDVGEIWYRPESGDPLQTGEYDVEVVRMQAYREIVRDFFRRDGARFLERWEQPWGVRFHVYYKCEACTFLPNCLPALSEPKAVVDWDVSAVPGMDQQSKTLLGDLGIQTVGALARSGARLADVQIESHRLKSQRNRLVARAEALLSDETRLMPEARTLVLPPNVDVLVTFVADHDPIEDRLIALGVRVEEPGEDPTEVLRTITSHDEERGALIHVLRSILGVLERCDSHNEKALPEDAWTLHVVAYEPSEATVLRNALGRHLAEPVFNAGLLDLVRLFPPEEVKPEPGYQKDLPVAALKGVLGLLFAMPTSVTLDLRRTSQALARHDARFGAGYQPAPGFALPFSSRLSLDVRDALLEGTLPATAVKRDVAARLRACAELVRGLVALNADFPLSEQFLQMRKPPFRFERRYDPIRAGDLDILRIQQEIQRNGERLKTLSELARPLQERRDRLNSLANLEFKRELEERRGRKALIFNVPRESRDSEISADDWSLILTDGDAAILLDEGRWSEFAVRIAPRKYRSTVIANVTRAVFDGEPFQRLWQRRSEIEWFIDRVHSDVNTPRLLAYLEHLTRLAGATKK